MAGTPEGGEKAAKTRGRESLAEAGRKGAEALASDPQKKSEASRKAAETRGHDEMAAIGRKGGEHSHGGGRSSGEQSGRKQEDKE
jgi:uncharacterized protein